MKKNLFIILFVMISFFFFAYDGMSGNEQGVRVGPASELLEMDYLQHKKSAKDGVNIGISGASLGVLGGTVIPEPFNLAVVTVGVGVALTGCYKFFWNEAKALKIQSKMNKK